jgi:hypothetical protein
MKRWGRRPVFLAAAGLALVGAGLQLAALYKGSYGLLLVGAALQVGELVKGSSVWRHQLPAATTADSGVLWLVYSTTCQQCQPVYVSCAPRPCAPHLLGSSSWLMLRFSRQTPAVGIWC